MSRSMSSSDHPSQYGDSTSALVALLAALDRLTPSAEPQTVYAEALRQGAPQVWQAGAVELTDADGHRHVVQHPAVQAAVLDGMPVSTATLAGDTVYTPFRSAEGEDGPSYSGVLVLRFDGVTVGPAEALIGRLVVDHVGSLVQREALTLLAREERIRSAHLEKALESSRDIGTALGILMASQKCRSDDAFEQLRRASQSTHRKVREIALDIIDTGVLDLEV